MTLRFALIPVKELSQAKARLAPVLDAAARRELALALFRDVLAAALACRALKGPADRMLASLGHEASAAGVARLYADFLDVLMLDREDAGLAPQVESLGVRPVVTETIMRDEASRRALAEATLKAVGLG